MSKPISFGFGKSKSNGNGTSASSRPAISLPLKKPILNRPSAAPHHKHSALRSEEDEEEEEINPKHESVTGFSSSGVILSQPVEEKKTLVIENAGNLDWRRRRKNILPDEVRAVRDGQDIVMVERDQVSTTSGLQLAQPTVETLEKGEPNPVKEDKLFTNAAKPIDADQEALQALLQDDNEKKSRSTAIIEQQADTLRRPQDDTDDFRSDVASRPDSATLADYDSMPVEEFGMAMLRGMGKKRRANGEVIELDQKEEPSRKLRKQEGFLGIGAKAAPGMNDIELGAWGKAEMRQNSKGAGFFTPVILKNKATGETVTEEELDRRKRETERSKGDQPDDWRERRDRNLSRKGRDQKGDGGEKYQDERNRDSRRHRDEGGYESSRSRREKNDSDYESSRSHRHRSRSRENSRGNYTDDQKDESKDRKRDRRKGDYNDNDGRRESSSSRRDRDRDRDSGRERDRYTDRQRRDHDYDRDDRRHRDRR